MSDRVLITCQQMQDCIDLFKDRFERHGIDVRLPALHGQQLSEDELIAMIGDIDGVIAGDDSFSARVLARAPRLRVIAKWGIGIDGIDLQAAAERGVEVSNTPGVFGDDVADVAAGYLVMLARQLHRMHASVIDGGWLKVRGEALTGRTLGVTGFGSIGAAVARRGHGFGMHVIGHDIAPVAIEEASRLGVPIVDQDALFTRSRYLVLCAPLTPDTRHMVNERTLALMAPGSYVINVSRGALVDERALVAALRTGHVAAAGLDVFEDEPLPSDSELRSFPQCVFGAHNGSNTQDGTVRASEQAVRNVLSGLGYEA